MSKHNVLLLNSMKFMGGGETWMLRMARYLVDRGHDATIVARPESEMITQGRSAGLRAIPLWIAGDLNPILLWKLARLVRDHRIDTIVANTGRDIRISGLVALVHRRLRVVGLYQVDRPIRNKWNYRLTFNHFADALVVNSDSTRRTILQSSPWLVDERIHVIPHGLDPTPYQSPADPAIRASFGLPPAAVVIGFVGRLSGQKGITPLLEAMEVVARTHANAHLVIAGIGTLEEKIRRFRKERDLEDRIHLLGFREDVPELMKSFDFLLVPSIWEGFGLVLIEAMAAGTACIASDVSSIPEIVQDNVNGLLVPPGDPNALATATDRMIRDPELRNRLAHRGQQDVLEKFTIDRMLSAYEQLFDSLANE